MLTSQGFNLPTVGRQLGQVRFSGQDRRANGVTSCRFDVADEVRERPALADKVIDEEIIPIAFHLTLEKAFGSRAAESRSPPCGQPYLIALSIP